jgi:hypothetical protein
LADAIFEQIEQMLDEAQQVLRDGLKSRNIGIRLQAATALLTLSRLGGTAVGEGVGPRMTSRPSRKLSRRGGSTNLS